VLERAGDLAGILTNLEKGDVLFIDEIHRIPHVVEEYLYSAMEDYSIEIMIDKGPHARSVKMQLPRFTLIGATTRSGLLTAPLRSRFGIIERLNYYENEDLATIVKRSAKILEIGIDEKGALEIAGRARGTPRIANRLLRRVRDYAQVKAQGRITADVADQGLKMLGVDQEGLDPMDKRILQYILKECKGGPVGVSSLAVGVGEDAETLEEIYEPYLIQRGFLKRTSAGRVATELTYQHFNVKPPASSKQLF
jgi:Holliday junction DNA helicase RuvB